MKMTPEAQEHWDDDDLELEQEFEDVVSSYRDTRGAAPRVPSALDRLIREQARYHIGDELRHSWIFGHIPQISLVASIFFGIGVYFIFALESDRLTDGDKRPEPIPKPVETIPVETTIDEAALLEAARSSAPDYRTQLDPTRSSTMPSPATLNALRGQWKGDNSMWLDPQAEPQESDATASVDTAARDKFVTIAYTWVFEDKPQEGMLLIGSDDGRVQASWVDSFHMGDEIMECEGTLLDDGGVSVTGAYAAPPDPDWGWRIEIHPVSDDEFQMLMFNITPAGEDALAVEANFRRS